MVDIKELDPGHLYQLPLFDYDMFGYNPRQLLSDEEQYLQFMKREGPNYPGNTDSYSGTNLQSVLRACRLRLRYLNNQHRCVENYLVLACIAWAIWWLEFRAARRHGRLYWHATFDYAFTASMCPTCGHTDCREHS